MAVVQALSKKLPISALVVLVMFLFTTSSFAQEKTDTKAKVQTEEKTTVNENVTPINSICPVSHEDVDPTITYEYKGKTYGFCCNKCLAKFKKDPEKYISRVDKENKTDKKKMDENKSE